MRDGPDRFAPLGGGEAGAAEAPHVSTPATAAATDWQPEAPAPEDPPPAPRHRRLGNPAAVWTYRDAEGQPLFAVCRFNAPDGGGGKEILPHSFGTLRGARGWHWKGPAKPVPLYGLPQLAARPGAPVVVVEGEKAADAAAVLFPEHVAVTWQGGARAVRFADWSALAGRVVVVWPDNDSAGRDAAADVAAALARAGAASVAVVDVPRDWPDAWDVADPPPEGASAETLAEMLLAAQPLGDEGGGGAAEDDAKPQPPRDPAMPRPFYMRAGGIFWADPDEAEGRPLHVCGPLDVVAQTDDGTGWNCGALLRWPGPCGRVHEWPMPRRMTPADRSRVIALDAAPAASPWDALRN